MSNYERKRSVRLPYPKEILMEALKVIENGGMSFIKASQHYGVPKSTLYDYAKKNRHLIDHPSINARVRDGRINGSSDEYEHINDVRENHGNSSISEENYLQHESSRDLNDIPSHGRKQLSTAYGESDFHKLAQEELMNETQTLDAASSVGENESKSNMPLEDFNSSADEMQIDMKTSSAPPSKIPSLQSLVRMHLTQLKSDKGRYIYDTVYGIHLNPYDECKIQMGNTEVRFTKDDIILLRENEKIASHPISEGLLELLFMKKPYAALRGDISELEREIYSIILRSTNAAYDNCDARACVSDRSTMKYTHIIKPIMMKEALKTLSKYDGVQSSIGEVYDGASTDYMYYDNPNTDYLYYENPQELINRLRLLWHSKMAGRSGLDNEIIGILEKLREEGVIS